MKHAFNFLLIFLFCFTLAACGGGDDTVNPDPDPIDTGGSSGDGDSGGDGGSGDDGGDGGDDGGDDGSDDGGDDGTTDENPADGPISPIPNFFTYKMVIEEATGTWCGWCPMGFTVMDNYIEEHPNRVYGVAIHSGDPMENRAIIGALDRAYDLQGFPSGLINRLPSPTTRETFMHPEYWAEVLDRELETETTSVGVAMESNINQAEALATVQVHVGFGEGINTDKEYKILLYLIEDGIVETQQNYLSGDSRFRGGIYNFYYEAPAVLEDFVHNHVAKRTFTGLNGDAIPAENVGAIKKFKKEYQINLSRDNNLEKSHIVAVVLSEGNRPHVLNAQKVKLGEVKDWD